MEACSLLVNLRKGMQSSSEQPLVGEERYVMTRITAVKETNTCETVHCFYHTAGQLPRSLPLSGKACFSFRVVQKVIFFYGVIRLAIAVELVVAQSHRQSMALMCAKRDYSTDNATRTRTIAFGKWPLLPLLKFLSFFEYCKRHFRGCFA